MNGLHGFIYVYIFMSLLTTTSCTSNTDPIGNSKSAVLSCETVLKLPLFRPGSKYEQWHLLFFKSGQTEWNGQKVNVEEIRRYMVDLSKMPDDAGKLAIHIEPGLTCENISSIKSVIEDSPLCREGRCVLDVWAYDKPIVN